MQTRRKSSLPAKQSTAHTRLQISILLGVQFSPPPSSFHFHSVEHLRRYLPVMRERVLPWLMLLLLPVFFLRASSSAVLPSCHECGSGRDRTPTVHRFFRDVYRNTQSAPLCSFVCLCRVRCCMQLHLILYP